jgi:hypothetical protein
MSGTIRSTWSQPVYNSSANINGTPSVYAAALTQHSGYYDVSGQYGFHFNTGASTPPTDLNAVTTVNQMFNPLGGTAGYPSVATNYNSLMMSLGATETVGQRDTLITTTNRYNLQEIHSGSPGTDWNQWRVWLYKFNETTAYPTGAGTVTKLAPQTPGASYSFGNPSVSVVDRPNGGGKALVVTYTVFAEGAGRNPTTGESETGTLIYYFNI